WIGFDQPRKLGNGETGGTAALPMWIGFMEKALKGVPESYMETPPGLVSVSASDPGGRGPAREYVYKEHLPPPDETPAAAGPDANQVPHIVVPAPEAKQETKPEAKPDAKAKAAEKPQQAPAPVQDAKPKPVDRKDKAAAAAEKG
ncbi:MAG TPA: hypothetical protein VF801_14530, partial [Rhodocyclaceae bacterium]